MHEEGLKPGGCESLADEQVKEDEERRASDGKEAKRAVRTGRVQHGVASFQPALKATRRPGRVNCLVFRQVVSSSCRP